MAASKVFLRRVREKPAEDKTNKWYDAKYPGLRTKLNLQGRRGWPDQCYWIAGGRPFLIEFKAEGEDPRKLQAYIHEQLRNNGYDVEVHTDAAEAIAALKRRIAGAQDTAAALDLHTARLVAQAATRRADEALERFKGSAAELSAAIAEQGDTKAQGKPAGKRRGAKALEAAQVPGEGGEVLHRPAKRRPVPKSRAG